MDTMHTESYGKALLTVALAVLLSGGGNYSVCHGQSTSSDSKNEHPLWRVGAFFCFGEPPNYSIVNSHVPVSANVQLQMYSFGMGVGRKFGKTEGAGVFRGNTEMMAEVIPVWIARYPSQKVPIRYGDGSTAEAVWKGQSFFGSSITPLMARRNFVWKSTPRYVPWVQLGAGVLWTNHKFPMTVWAAPSSAFNFTPQVGAGISIVQHSTRSVEFGVRIIHISNAGLGDSNPGINQTIMGTVGYSWLR